MNDRTSRLTSVTSLDNLEQVVKNPMDLGTIREKLDLKNGAGYKDIQEICDDVRLVFTNAMSYNQDGSDVYVMAKTLSDKFEEKWKTALEPKLAEEVYLTTHSALSMLLHRVFIFI